MLRIGSLVLAVTLFGCGEDSNGEGTTRRGASWQVSVTGESLDFTRSGTDMVVDLVSGDTMVYEVPNLSGAPHLSMALPRGSDGEIQLGEQEASVRLWFSGEYSCDGSVVAVVLHERPADVTFSGDVTCKPLAGGASIPAEASGRFNQSGAPSP